MVFYLKINKGEKYYEKIMLCNINITNDNLLMFC